MHKIIKVKESEFKEALTRLESTEGFIDHLMFELDDENAEDIESEKNFNRARRYFKELAKTINDDSDTEIIQFNSDQLKDFVGSVMRVVEIARSTDINCSDDIKFITDVVDHVFLHKTDPNFH